MKYIYLLKVGDKHYKVGVAKNVTERVKGLQTSNPNLIEVVTIRIVEDEYAYEASLHNYLQQMKADGGKEWFVLTPEQALSLAILINKTPSVDITQQITLRTILYEHEKQIKSIAAKVDTVSNKLRFVPLNKEAVEIIKEHKEAQQNKNKIPIPPSDDILLQDAIAVCRDLGKASTSLIQRKLSIGYGRAARMIELLEEQGIIGPADGSRPRQIIG